MNVEIYADGVRRAPARSERGVRLGNDRPYPGVLGPWEGGWLRCVSGSAGTIVAAVIRSNGWETRIASGPETGALGRRKADKALWAEGFRWARVLRVSKGRRAMGTTFRCPVWRLRWSSWLRRYRLRFRAGARDIWVGVDWVGGRWMAVGLGGGPE